MSTERLYLLQDINPVPWKAPEVGIGRRNGKVYPQVYASAEVKAYKSAIKEALERHAQADSLPVDDPVYLRFFFWRQLPDYETERERRARKHEADATNLQKATEDALQGILFSNDRQVVGVESWVMEQGHGTRPLIAISVQYSPRRPELDFEIPAGEPMRLKVDRRREEADPRDVF